jgi:hypothetical protein
VKILYNRSNPSKDGIRSAVQVSAPAGRRGYQFDRLQIRIQVSLRYGYQTFQVCLFGFLNNINEQYRQNAGDLIWTNFHLNNTVKIKSIELFSGAKRYGKRKQYYHTLTRTSRSQTGCNLAMQYLSITRQHHGLAGLECWNIGLKFGIGLFV